MLRQVLSVSASVTLLAGLTACGNDSDAGSTSPSSSTPTAESSSASETPSSTPSDAPPVGYKQNPGQADKVKAAATGAGLSCSELSDQYYTFTACSKPAPRFGLTWFKYVAAKDGTVVFANTSKFEDVKPAITAVVGATDANVLLANGTTLKWGYGGPNWVSIKGMNSAPEPPQAKPFESTRADVVRVFQDDPALRCKVEDPEPTATTPADPNEITPSMSATPAAPSAIACEPRGYDANKVVWASMAFAGDALTKFSMRSSMNDLGASDAKELAEGKAQLLRSLNRLWPALKGGDTQAIKAFVEAHLTPTGSALAYVDGRRVRVDVIPGTGHAAKLEIEVANEKVGLEEPKS